MKLCPTCNKKFETGKFCPECGTALIDEGQELRCSCGAKLEPSMKFCPECGAKVQFNNESSETASGAIHAEANTQKPHFTVGTIGHAKHGKTTLSAAISKYCGKKYGDEFLTYEEIKKLPKNGDVGTVLNYQSERKQYTHIDCPGEEKYLKNMISSISQMDGAIIVIDGPESVMPQTREHLFLARQLGVPKIIVFLNKVEMVDDPDLLELVIEEVRDTVIFFGFDEDTPLIKGSAFLALKNNATAEDTKCIKELISAMDTWFNEANSKSLSTEEIESQYADTLFFKGASYLGEAEEDTNYIEEGFKYLQEAIEAGSNLAKNLFDKLKSSKEGKEIIANIKNNGKILINQTVEEAVPIIRDAALSGLKNLLK